MIPKTTRSILSVLLAALLLVTSTPLTPAFADGGAVSPQSANSERGGLEQDGDGTADDPYKIATAEELREFAQRVNGTDDNSADPGAHAKLMNDIDLSEICGENVDGQSVSWTPIGTSSSRYTGTFDGDGHTISGLYINNSRADYQGLFGYVGTGGTVKDLTVSGSVKGDNYVGGVVGYNISSTVENCYNTVTVTGTNDCVGGVVGYNNGGTVENCYNTGEVSGPDSGNSVIDSYVGGVVGQNFGGTVENCYNTGKVSGPDSSNSSTSDVGGVVGRNGGNVEGFNRGTVENCYNTGSVSGNSVGGVVGYNYNGGSVTNSYNTGEVSGKISVGGVVGYNHSGGNVTGCYFLQQNDVPAQGIGDGSGTTGATAVTTLDALCENFESVTGWKTNTTLNRPVLISNHEDDGSKDHPYEIFTATQLENFRDLVNRENGNPAAHAKLMNNIDLSSVCGENAGESEQPVSWNPIGTSFSNSYSGTFDGDGHTISGLYINSGSDSYQGLFGRVNGGTVQDLSVSGSVSGNWYVGGVVGYNNGGTVTGCIFSGSGSGTGVTGSKYVGGVVGQNFGGTVENCYNTGSVTGVIGVTGSTDYVGGVVGQNYNGTVENCYNTGSVSGSYYVGGVVGWNRSIGNVTNCYFLKTADVNETLSGIGSGTGTATEKDDTAFHSGEVAWRLQAGQKAAGEGGVVPLVWGQSDLNTPDSWPTLVALNPDAAKEVYQLIFDWHYEGAPEGTTTTTNVYTNGSVTIPEINHDRTGYHISGWKDKNGKPVTAGTTVGEDADFTAEWTANTYTITVTAGSGGTVSGGGNVTHGDSVEVTATANQGYHFVNWTENGTEVSTSATYSFTATANRTLTANFAADAVEPDPEPTPTPDPEPTGPSTGDSSGWTDILDELENTAKGDEITIDMGDETKVPAEIFESLAGKDVDVTFDLGDIQWSVNGADIPTDTDFTDLDLGVNLDTHGIPVNVINTITGEVGTVQITLAHNGEFGFIMTLTAPLGKENAGYWANLYHYDEDAEALNFEAAAKIDEDGSVTIPFSHASQYAIVIDTHSHAAVDVSDIFTDVAPNAWYKDAVQYAYAGGLMTGVFADAFAPEQTTTRAMIVSILARLEGVTTAQAAGFADVDDNDWYATAVNWAANVGVVNGYEDNTFQPNTAITREQLAAILMNYAAYKGEDVSARADLTSYTDQPSTWAEETMSWAVAEGLISGMTADTLQPQGSATRAQVAAILERFLAQ